MGRRLRGEVVRWVAAEGGGGQVGRRLRGEVVRWVGG